MAVRTRPLRFGQLEITVSEMSVKDLRNWLHDVVARKNQDLDMFEALLAGDGPTLTELALMCSLQPAEFDQLSQGELGQLIEAARELNPNFFTMQPALTEKLKPVLDVLTRQWLFRQMLPDEQEDSSTSEATPSTDGTTPTPTPTPIVQLSSTAG